MKRSAFIIAILFCVAIGLRAQIPNNGFEIWTTSGNCLKPAGWSCLNDWMGSTDSCYSMSRSDDHYPASIGNYSIKIENRISILPDAGAGGMVWVGDSTGFGTDQPAFLVTGHPTSLCGYYKFFPHNGDKMDIHFVLYKNGTEVTGGGMKSSTLVSQWTSFKITVSSPDYADADSARLLISSFDADDFPNVYGNSVLYIDNLSFDVLITSMDEQVGQKSKFDVYPNPADNHFVLDLSRVYNAEIQLEIYNALGIMVASEILKPGRQEINIENLCNGVYLVLVKSLDVWEVQKLIIQR